MYQLKQFVMPIFHPKIKVDIFELACHIRIITYFIMLSLVKTLAEITRVRPRSVERDEDCELTDILYGSDDDANSCRQTIYLASLMWRTQHTMGTPLEVFRRALKVDLMQLDM